MRAVYSTSSVLAIWGAAATGQSAGGAAAGGREAQKHGHSWPAAKSAAMQTAMRRRSLSARHKHMPDVSLEEEAAEEEGGARGAPEGEAAAAEGADVRRRRSPRPSETGGGAGEAHSGAADGMRLSGTATAAVEAALGSSVPSPLPGQVLSPAGGLVRPPNGAREVAAGGGGGGGGGDVAAVQAQLATLSAQVSGGRGVV